MTGHLALGADISTTETGTAPRVLAVDDDADMAELIVRVARKAGCEGRALREAKTLAEVISDWAPDIVTLDLMMPGGDGYDVLSILKANAYRGRLIIVSGQREPLLNGAAAHATAGGLHVAACVRKPIDVNSFGELIKDIISGKIPAP